MVFRKVLTHSIPTNAAAILVGGGTVAGGLLMTQPRCTLCEKKKQETSSDESARFQKALAHHDSQITSYRKQWEYSAESNATTSTKTPSRSWPDNVPTNEDLSWMIQDMKYCQRSPTNKESSYYCSRLMFRIASALLIQFDDTSQQRGLAILQQLANQGYADAMVYLGMCLNNGLLSDPNSEEAVIWFKLSADMYQHSQAQYELGVAYYTGEGVEEDEEYAVRLFLLAANQNHPAACYMCGDCLLDGVGVDIDRAKALEWLVKAAQLGHRGARSRVMACLEHKKGVDYEGFTDASRQTLVEHSTSTPTQTVRRRPTLQKVGGSGRRDQTELVRRQTIVAKSRSTV